MDKLGQVFAEARTMIGKAKKIDPADPLAALVATKVSGREAMIRDVAEAALLAADAPEDAAPAQ